MFVWVGGATLRFVSHQEDVMSHLIRRSLPVKAFAFVTLLAVSGLIPQEIDPCEDKCHVEASNVYNDMVEGGGKSDEDARRIGAAHKAACVFASCG